jgi:[ribosomal protein S5]-alanine N-acetyltransferase
MTSPAPLPTIDLGLPGWCLRAWRDSDAPSLARHADNLEVWRWMSDAFPHPYTIEIAEQWVRGGHVDFGGDNWAICFNDEAVGGCGLHQEEAPQFRCNAEVGWWIGQAHWGQGVVTRAATALVQAAFARPEISRVYAPIHAGNTRSMRVAEKNGFRLEGVQPQSAFKDCRLVDRWVFGRYRN